MKRPALDQLLDSLREGDVLVVARLDRLARSVIDGARIIERAQRERWQLVIIDVGVDTTTPSGEMVANVVLSIAQWESRMMGERIRSSMAKLHADGRTFGRPRLVPADVRALIVRQHRAGDGIRAIATLLNDRHVPTVRGGKQWWPTTVARVLEQEGVYPDRAS